MTPQPDQDKTQISKSTSESGKKQSHANKGNFKNDPARAAAAGRKGGENSHGGGHKSSI